MYDSHTSRTSSLPIFVSDISFGYLLITASGSRSSPGSNGVTIMVSATVDTGSGSVRPVEFGVCEVGKFREGDAEKVMQSNVDVDQLREHGGVTGSGSWFRESTLWVGLGWCCWSQDRWHHACWGSL